MGRRKHKNSTSEGSGDSCNENSYIKYNKSKKSKVKKYSDEENEKYISRKKKHKYKKKKHQSKDQEENSFSETESYHRHKHKRHRHKDERHNHHKNEEKNENAASRWDNEDEIAARLKTEPLTDSEDERTSSRNKKLLKHNDNKNTEEGSWGKSEEVKEPKAEPGENKEKVNFGLSGKLAEDSNTYNGVVIKYSQPPEARKPKRRWRWYIFKGDEELPFLPLHRQSAYLIGRERKVADIPTDHPSCSKQHAVLQYRLVSYTRADGSQGRTVKPYILDLESANGTFVNNRRIDCKKFVELLEKDVVKFGYSSREYVLLHEASKGSDEDMPDTGADVSPVSLLRKL